MRSSRYFLPILILPLALACGSKSKGEGDRVDAGAGPGVDAGPDAGPGEECTFIPTGQFNPAVECAWDRPGVGSPYPEMDDVVSTPVVVNMTDDNGDGVIDVQDIPDIAFISYQYQGACPPGATCGCCNSSGVLRVVSGACQDGALAEHFTVGAAEIEADIGVPGVWLDNSGGLAVGDIDADGSVDIVSTTRNGGTIAFERTGAVKWHQPLYPIGEDHLAATQPALADVDADGMPEVIQGRVVLSGQDGSLKWQGALGLGTNGFMGPVPALGNIDLTGGVELLAGNTAYLGDGSALWTYDYAIPVGMSGCDDRGYPCDGFTATGNFDADELGEVVITRSGILYLLEHDGSPMMQGGAPVEIAVPVDDCSRNEGGPPTVADFDGDGQAEIGVAGADFYIVADLECLADPLPMHCSDPGIRWKIANADCSSRVTGSSVFDFDGDGRAEVVYADEVEFRILDGIDGSERLAVPNSSHTRLEMPIVVDVDNDGNAEIVFVENDYNRPSQGLRVYGDATDSWVPTRRIWNQHSYHVTNVGELGQIPPVEPPNWLQPTDATASGVMNNFRQNLPEDSALAAPDLTIDLTVDVGGCVLVAEVCNRGDVVVGAGVPVEFFDNADRSPIACDNAPVTTSMPLVPGACESLTCTWSALPDGAVDVRACVDNSDYDCGAATGTNNECRESNNVDDDSSITACDPIE